MEIEEYTDNNDNKTLLIIMTTEDELNLMLHKSREYVVNPKQWINVMTFMNYNFIIYELNGTKKVENMKKKMIKLCGIL